METVRSSETAPNVECKVNLSVYDNSGYPKVPSKLLWAVWHFLGSPLLKSNLVPFAKVKVLILRLFGAKVGMGVNIKPGVRVKFPWLLSIGDYSWIGEDVWIDNLAQVNIGSHVCLSQAAYLCTGNHDWAKRSFRLFRQPITLEDGSWVGARATICPGVTIGTCAIATVGSVVAKPIPPYQVWNGNPAQYLRQREIKD